MKAHCVARFLRESKATASAFTCQVILVKIQMLEHMQAPKLHRYISCPDHKKLLNRTFDTRWAALPERTTDKIYGEQLDGGDARPSLTWKACSCTLEQLEI